MLDSSQHQALVNISKDASDQALQKALQWSKQQWPWADYGPLFRIVLNQDRTLSDGNIDKDEIKSIYHQGADRLRPAERFVSMYSISKEQREQMLEHIYEMHCQVMPRERLGKMVTIQIAKDASMAYALTSSPRSILVIGAYHSRKDLGVPHHISSQKKHKSPVVVTLVEVNPDKQRVSDYDSASTTRADYIWFTPRLKSQDYCESLKKKFGKQ